MAAWPTWDHSQYRSVICACRVKSTEIALEKAAADVKGSVLASDAFFPFSWGDSVEMACKVGTRLVGCADVCVYVC